MPTDYTLEIRKQTVACLRAYVPLVALVAASRIYGEETPVDPVWPFIRYGLPDSEPFDATGWSGSGGLVRLHAFQNGPYTDRILTIRKHIVDAMMNTLIPPGGTGVTQLEFVRAQLVTDTPAAELSKYHDIIDFDIAVAG